MSRFAVNPKWLVYLPPTMSPSETSQREGYLEYPEEAFAYYRKQGVKRVVCEQKHMGSRAVVVVCRDEDVARQRFGVVGEGIGSCYTRTGRPFFEDAAVQAQFLARIQAALGAAKFWERHQTDWACFDCELMPWSAKAQQLLRSQYAATGSAARAAISAAVEALRQGATRYDEAVPLLQHYQWRVEMVDQFIEGYRRYCWPVNLLEGYKLAPFHLLATEAAVHSEKGHEWHMKEIAAVCERDPDLLLATPYLTVDTTDEASLREAEAWWLDLTGSGGEGMVVKPSAFVAKGSRGLVQPAVKCRGREYLRIIYGAEYSPETALAKLRKRALAPKRSLALREFCLGIEALERFVRREPLRRVHECVFGVLALESEPVDPRL